MTVYTEQYTNMAGITEAYWKVRRFFIALDYAEFTYARWDWMITHSHLEATALDKIRLWMVDDLVVGIATFDTSLGTAYCLTLPNYAHLKGDMLCYAKEHLRNAKNGQFSIAISDDDVDFQMIALKQGFVATPHRESDAAFYINQCPIDYALPEGYKIVSMAERYDLYEYRRVLWKGFDHEANGEGELIFDGSTEASATLEMQRANVDLNLKLAVVSPEGHFVSYCGMWYDAELGYSVIEPVATDPEYRKLGLGKAVVLEGIRRTAALGATKALVGSSQQFYYSIGMVPYKTASIWRINK